MYIDLCEHLCFSGQSHDMHGEKQTVDFTCNLFHKVPKKKFRTKHSQGKYLLFYCKDLLKKDFNFGWSSSLQISFKLGTVTATTGLYIFTSVCISFAFIQVHIGTGKQHILHWWSYKVHSLFKFSMKLGFLSFTNFRLNLSDVNDIQRGKPSLAEFVLKKFRLACIRFTSPFQTWHDDRHN